MKKKGITKGQLKSEHVFKKIAAESLGVFVVSTFMLFTLFGIVISVKFLQFLKASLPMIVTLSGIMIEDKLLHPSKTP